MPVVWDGVHARARLSCFSSQPIETDRQPAQHPAICGVDLGRLAISLSAHATNWPLHLRRCAFGFVALFCLSCFLFSGSFRFSGFRIRCGLFFVPLPVFVSVCFSLRFVLHTRFVSFSWRFLCLFLAFSSPFFSFFFLCFFVARKSAGSLTAQAQLSSAQLSPAQPSRLPLSIDIHPRANERLNRRPTGWPINWLQRTDGQTDRTNAMYLAATSDPDLVPLCFVSWRDVARHGETRQAMKGARCSPCPPSALHSAATPAQANWQGRARYRPFAHRHARRQGGGRGGGEGHG